MKTITLSIHHIIKWSSQKWKKVVRLNLLRWTITCWVKFIKVKSSKGSSHLHQSKYIFVVIWIIWSSLVFLAHDNLWRLKIHNSMRGLVSITCYYFLLLPLEWNYLMRELCLFQFIFPQCHNPSNLGSLLGEIT